MYRKMMEDAKAQGLTSEKMMWESVEDGAIGNVLDNPCS